MLTFGNSKSKVDTNKSFCNFVERATRSSRPKISHLIPAVGEKQCFLSIKSKKTHSTYKN